MLEQVQKRMQKSDAEILILSDFFMIFGFHGAYQRTLGAILEAGTKKTSKRQITQSCFGTYFKLVLIPNRVFLHFWSAIFFACFWHRFWEASGPNSEDLGVVAGWRLGSF